MSQQLKSPAVKNNSKNLVLQVRFLLNRYHGSEWPPSPRRLFLALTAALYQSSNQRISKDSGERALKFLEGLQAPEIYAPTHKGCKYTIFVPNNDSDLISKSYAKGTEPSTDPRKLKTDKNIVPYIVDIIQYIWDIGSDKDRQRHVDVLCKLVKEIPVLGFGIDPVAAHGKMMDNIPHIRGAEHYTRDENSTDIRIQVPMSGLLEDAKRRHGEFLDRLQGDVFTKPGPITKCRDERYRKHRPITKCIAFKVTNHDDERHFVQNSIVPDMIKTIKKAMHIEKNSAIKTVVLPSIGGKHADGQIRRIGFIVSPDKNEEESINKLYAQTIKVSGQKYHLTPLPKDSTVQKNYQFPSRLWRSVTPVDLHIPDNTTRQNITKTILDALDIEGIKEHVTFVNFRKEPYWGGLARIPNRDKSLYIELEFKSKVTGPFVIGQNQDLGRGLFAPSRVSSIAYFTVLGARPQIGKTVMVAELMRRSVMSKIGDMLGKNAIPEYISGHDRRGEPLRSNHRQAFWLPTDADHDGLVDHIAVYVQDGFEKNIESVFYQIKELNDGQDLKFGMFFNGFYNKMDLEKKCNLFQKYKHWNSVTPYFAPWHIKKNFGRDDQIRKECEKRGFPCPAIEDSSVNQRMQILTARFYNLHNKLRPPDPTDHVMRLSFNEPVRGPLSLGYCSHFGLGMFIPDK